MQAGTTDPFAGRTRRGDALVVTADRIAKFAAGIAEPPGRGAHPLFSATVVIPTTGSLLFELPLGLDIARIVHAGVDFRFHRAVAAGDEISCTARCLGVWNKGTGTLVGLAFVVHDRESAQISEGETRYFVRGAKRDDRAAAPRGRAVPAGARIVRESVAAGQSLLYAEGSGDVFPIHTSPEFARSVGLPDVILHGMCTLAFATRAVVRVAGGGDAKRLGAVGVRFSKMVRHGDELSTHVWTGADGKVRFVTDNQRGERVLEEGLADIGPDGDDDV